jgi:hypothetical protein
MPHLILLRAADVIEQAVRCLLMAQNGPQPMSAVWSLLGGKRTSRIRPPTSENDPNGIFDLVRDAI